MWYWIATIVGGTVAAVAAFWGMVTVGAIHDQPDPINHAVHSALYTAVALGVGLLIGWPFGAMMTVLKVGMAASAGLTALLMFGIVNERFDEGWKSIFVLLWGMGWLVFLGFAWFVLVP